MSEPPFTLPPARKAADLAMLDHLATAPAAQRHSRRRGAAAAVGALVLIGGGAATAAAVQHYTATSASDTHTGRCYTTASKNFGDDFPGVSVGNAYRPGDSPRAISQTLVEDCSVLWQHGELRLGQPDGNYSENTDLPVPALSVCVLPNGQSAAFPGTNVCNHIGLPELLTK